MAFTFANAPTSFSATARHLALIENSGSDEVRTKTCTLRQTEPKEPSLFSFNKRRGYTINREGLKNPGYDYYRMLKFKKPYIISIAGTAADLREIFAKPTTADMYEINVSCPNVASPGVGGNVFATLDDLGHLMLESPLPYGVKLAPYTTMAALCETAVKLTTLFGRTKLEYIVCCNTFPGIVDGETGGISGPALKPLALWNVYHFRSLLSPDIRIIGCGGVTDVKDAIEYREAGADGVQIGTDMVVNGQGIFSRLKYDISSPII